MQQTVMPANLHAVVMDHDYLALSTEDQFLHDANIITTDSLSRDILQKATCGQAASKLWVDERTKCLTASTFHRICHLTSKTDRERLVYQLTKPSTLSNEATRHGIKYEGVAVAKFEKITGTRTEQCGTFIHPERAYLSASPDRLLGDDAILEVKCPHSA